MVDYTNSKGTVRGRAVTHKIDGKTVTKWEFADKIPYTPPRVLTREEAAARGGFDKPKRLTGTQTAYVPRLGDGSKFYRRVELGNGKIQVTRGNRDNPIVISAIPVNSAANKIYISDKLAAKPKLIHQVDTAISEVLTAMGLTDAENLPEVFVIDSSEMAKNAVAAYRVSDNRLFVEANYAVYTQDKVPEAMRDFTCPEDYRSTYFHEMYHWLDAHDFRAKQGEINAETYDSYEQFVQTRAKKALDKLMESGYNIFKISEYATESYENGLYDETYTEYRTLKAIKR
jgi:hypothetical protein